jgi:hypothetical protein
MNDQAVVPKKVNIFLHENEYSYRDTVYGTTFLNVKGFRQST